MEQELHIHANTIYLYSCKFDEQVLQKFKRLESELNWLGLLYFMYFYQIYNIYISEFKLRYNYLFYFFLY